jgi:hypothetical protein
MVLLVRDKRMMLRAVEGKIGRDASTACIRRNSLWPVCSRLDI